MEAATTFLETWRRFGDAPHTLGPSPGARDAWRRGRERYAVWLLRVDAPPVLERLAAVADRALPHGIVAFREPHVTLFVAGFPCETPEHDDDIAHAALEDQARALASSVPSAPRLAVGRVNAFLTCVFLEVLDPHGDLEALRGPLAGPAREVRFAPYQPHVTVGAFSDDRPTAPIAAALAPFRGLPPLPLRPTAAELVVFDAARAGAPLVTIRTVPLFP